MKKKKITDPFYWSAPWLAVRQQALERDNYTCQKCLRKWKLGLIPRPRDATMVHHIKPRKQYPELELVLDNLESLCDQCHNEEHPERGFRRKTQAQALADSGQRCVLITNEREMDHDRV